MSEHVLHVSRRSVAAARVKLALDRVAGRKSAPAVRVIANAKSPRTLVTDNSDTATDSSS